MERAPPRLRAVLVIGLLLSTGAATGILGLTPVRALPAATLETPYTATGVDADSPPDGQYDYLVVELTVNVSSAGGFLLWVDLSGRGLASRWLNLDLGRHRVQLPIDGHVLRGMGVDGPYGLDLTLETDTSALLDRASFTTAAFRFTDFEGPDTVMTGPTSDRGLDMDVPPNGLLDFMEVTTSVRVTEAGWYRLSATTLGVGSFVDRWLDPGPAANLSVRFPGFELSQSRYSGRFTVDLFFGTNHSSYVTRSYNWTDFEPVPAAIGTGASDAGIDTDTPPDGLYDELSVRIPVSVNHSGDYRIGATAYSGNQYVDRAEAYRFIANGSGEIELRIPRTRIVANQMDGPFRVDYWLYESTDILLAQGTYMTAAYRWTEFDPLPAVLTGPVTDEYRDNDRPADGLFDAYVARIPVQVNEPGVYRFTGVANGRIRQIEAINTTFLPVGAATVEVAWPLGSFGAQDSVPGQFGASWVMAHGIGSDETLFYSDITASPAPSNTSFAPSAVSVSGSPATLLPDADGNGKFDALVAVVNLTVRKPGTYTFSAALLSLQNNYRVTWATNHTVLLAGARQITLGFPGWAIRASGLDGSYLVMMHFKEGPKDVSSWDFDLSSEYTLWYTPMLFYHQFDDDRPTIQSAPASVPPTIDGTLTPGEWAGATSVSLATSDSGGIAGSLLISNDDRFMYVALDVSGDSSDDSTDSAGIAFDVGTLDVADAGREDQIAVGFAFPFREREFHTTYSSVYASEGWRLRDHPIDRSSPDRAGLLATMGFGPSPRSSTPHRVYEFRVPLRMLGTRGGGVIGFAVTSALTGGITDGSGAISGWPVSSLSYENVNLNNFARVRLVQFVPAGTGSSILVVVVVIAIAVVVSVAISFAIWRRRKPRVDP